MANWVRQEINWDEDNTISYFRRKMPTKNIRKRAYLAHIYLCNFKTEEELKNNWEDINSKIAVYDQSNIESLIERSNFYICFFIKENVSLKVQNSIEGDTFSAKKYVFFDNNMSVEDKCEHLEKKLFTINIDSPCNVNEKVKKIELTNFRAYEGRNQIDLCLDDDNPASFVTIYAPNGIGKTSIFDGLEYAFKGSVGRLSDIPDQEIGAVYHNRNHIFETAYVDVELEFSGSIVRKVGNVRDGGNDTRRNPPIKGRELVGKPELWEQTILPHDKIDSFITAKSGVDRYKEWIKSTDIDVSISNNFSISHKEMKENENQIVGINEEIEERSKELLELRKQTDKIDLWKFLIIKYNHENKKRQLNTLSEVFEEGVYNSIINAASLYIRKDNKMIEDCEKHIVIAERILKKSVDYYVDRLERIPQHKKLLEDIQKKIDDRKNYDELSQKNKYYTEEVQKIEKELEPIKKIIQFGKEYVTKQKEEYLLRKQQISLYNNDIESKLEEQNKYQEFLDKKEKEIKEICAKVSEEYKNKSIENIIGNYMKLKINLESVTKCDDKIVESEKQITEEMGKLAEALKTLNGKYISKALSELKYQDILNLSDFLEQDFIDNLKDLLDKYQKTIKSLEMNQEKNMRFLLNKKDLEELKKSGQEYVNQHQELTECPLCHTNFFDWQKLFDAVNSIEQDGASLIQDELKKLREDILALNKEYDKTYETFDIIMRKLIRHKNESIEKIDNRKKEIFNRKKEVKTEKAKLREEIDEIRIFLEEEKIEVLETKETTIKEWFRRQGGLIKELHDVKNQYQLEVNKLKKENKKIVEMKSKQEEISKNTALIELISFLMNKPSDYDVIAEENKLNSKIEGEKDIITKNNFAISKIKINEEETVTYLLGKKKDEQKLLDEDIKLSEECELFNPLTKENIDQKLSEWEEEIKHSKANVELLNAILEENGIRDYHKKLRKLRSDKDNKIEELEKKRGLRTDLEEKYETSKNILKHKLDEYFNQTIISEVFQKIDPHQIMKNIDYEFDINQDEKPELFIRVSSAEGSDLKDSYRPECFFSSAQLNMVAFSSFFSRALQAKNLPISTIFIDDPIGHFDDINILGFSDLLRSVMEVHDCQIVLTTHDDKVFQILERKLSNEYYSSKFIKLPEDCIVLE